MFGQKKHGLRCAPLSPEARAWEAEQLRALGLADVAWEAEACCPRCQGGDPSAVARMARRLLPMDAGTRKVRWESKHRVHRAAGHALCSGALPRFSWALFSHVVGLLPQLS